MCMYTQVKYTTFLHVLAEKHRCIHIFLLGKSMLNEGWGVLDVLSPHRECCRRSQPGRHIIRGINRSHLILKCRRMWWLCLCLKIVMGSCREGWWLSRHDVKKNSLGFNLSLLRHSSECHNKSWKWHPISPALGFHPLLPPHCLQLLLHMVRYEILLCKEKKGTMK